MSNPDALLDFSLRQPVSASIAMSDVSEGSGPRGRMDAAANGSLGHGE